MEKYLWLLLAALSGGAVSQIRRGSPMPLTHRIAHAAAGAVCAVYMSPFLINYFSLADSDGKYLVPFAVGCFWMKVYERAEELISAIRLPGARG